MTHANQNLHDRLTMSRAAARAGGGCPAAGLAATGQARIIAATGASQFDFLEALTGDARIDWARVEMFHLDEYVGLPIDHPASFRKYLRERLIRQGRHPRYHLLDAESDPPRSRRASAASWRRRRSTSRSSASARTATSRSTIRPPTSRPTRPYLVVTLDEACRRQQVGEGWFPSVDGGADAGAVDVDSADPESDGDHLRRARRAQGGGGARPASRARSRRTVPASILRRASPNVTVYLDRDAAALLDAVDARPGSRARRRMSVRAAGLLRSAGQRLRRRRFQRPATDAEAIAGALDRMRATGVTRCLPTLITSSLEEFTACARAVLGLAASGDRRPPHGGPLHFARGRRPRRPPRAHVVPARDRRLRAPAGGLRRRIRLVTLAPEVPGASPLIEHLVRIGRARRHRPHRGDRRADRRRASRRAPPSPRTSATAARRCCPVIPTPIWELLAADDVSMPA